MLFEPTVSAATVLHPLLSDLAARLAGDNERMTGPRLRLRVVVHEGQVLADEHGYVGEDLNHAFRLLDAPATRAALANSPSAHAVLVVSDTIFQGIVRHRYQGLDPSEWQPVRVHAKETRTRAWVHLPGLPQQPDLSAALAAPPVGPATPPIRWTAMLLGIVGVAAFLWSAPALLDRSGKLFSVIGGLVALVSLGASAVTFRMASRVIPAEADPVPPCPPAGPSPAWRRCR